MKRLLYRAALLNASGYIALVAVMAPCAAQSQVDRKPDVPQGAASTVQINDIIVTARRRSERDIDVPVAITAFSGSQIDRQGLSDLSAIASRVPELNIATNISTNGGTLTLRGVSSASSTASVEQAVTVNVDGIPVSYAGIVRLGQFDLGQAEVLKGPQALFFGKNASGGIISLKSAEPTDHLDVLFRGAYETEAQEYVGEAHISGPLSDNVQARLAVRYSDMAGWINNVIPAGAPGVFGPAHRKSPGTDEFSAKAAINLQPNDAFSIKLKSAYSKINTQGTSLSQRYVCPLGSPQGPSNYPGQTDCKLDNQTAIGDLDPALHAVDPAFPADGVPAVSVSQYLLVGEANHELSDTLTLSSITGYYNLSLRSADHFSFGPVALFSAAEAVKKHSLSEELRLTSGNAGPFNWMAGIFLQRDYFASASRVVAGQFVLPYIDFLTTKGATVSPFVQANYALTSALSVSAGVRYTDETKKQSNAQYGSQLPHKISFKDWSPEVTLSYKPITNLNIYASYRQGYKSGGFQTEFVGIPLALAAGATIDNSYDAEHVQGFEGGIKASLLDNALRLNAAIYRYKYTGLQLGRLDPALATTVIENIGASTTKGAELNISYSPPVEGLNVFGAISYNVSQYDRYLSACYAGQTSAEGCDNAANVQNLAGRDLPRAPRWSGNAGGAYEGAIGDSLNFRLDARMTFSSHYELMSELIPGSAERHYSTYDAGASIGAKDGLWELAVIGRNLSNKIVGSSSGQVPFTGSATTRSDVFTTVSRGREILLRLTFRPFGNRPN